MAEDSRVRCQQRDDVSEGNVLGVKKMLLLSLEGQNLVRKSWRGRELRREMMLDFFFEAIGVMRPR